MAGKTDNPGGPRGTSALDDLKDALRKTAPQGTGAPDDLYNQADAALNGYLRWSADLQRQERFAFRGHASAAWILESSALRRLNKGRKIFPDLAGFVLTGYLDDIVNKIRVRFPEYDQLTDLEIMAHLQHQGGATGLIDFTESPLVALYFACQPAPEKEDGLPLNQNGKVLAVQLDGRGMSEVRKKEDLQNKADHFFPASDGKLWFWTPSHDPWRMLMQRSLFIFGRPSLDGIVGVKFHNIPAAVKPDLLHRLEMMGVSEKTLFSDFPGFANANACGQEYPARSAESYYTDNIEREPKSPYPRFGRGVFRHSIRDYKGAIEDYSHAIQRGAKNEGYVSMLFARGAAKFESKDYQGAVEDWKEAKRIGEQTGNERIVKMATVSLAKFDKPK